MSQTSDPQPTTPQAASEASSPDSPAAPSGPFIANAGPVFDPNAHDDVEPPAGADIHALPEPVDNWEPEQVRSLLSAKGAALHGMIGVGEQDWSYTEQDLAAIAPPLTRILNRYEPTRAAAHVGDELALVIGFGGYASRSIRERREILRAIEDAEPVPISGVAAPPGTGPGDDIATALANGIEPPRPQEGDEWNT